MENNTKRLDINEVIAYECHVRSLTCDLSSNVKDKGSFLGVIEKLDSIKSLGVNQLVFMPVYEFDEVLGETYGAPEGFQEEDTGRLKNYWGFAKGDYFSVKSSYGKYAPAEEFKSLVSNIHKRNMEIVLMFYFPYDINTETMLDCLKYWAFEYDIDGFFLNVNSFYLKVISDCSKLKDRKLYCYDIDNNLNYTNPERIAVYDFEYRNCLRRLLKGDDGAYKQFCHIINCGNKFKKIYSITSHNGFTLYDLYSYAGKHNQSNGEFNRDGEDCNYSDNCGAEGETADVTILNRRLRRMQNALIMLMLSNGIPMLLAGDEEANSQKGNNNAYCQDNEISWIQYDGSFSAELKKLVLAMSKLRNECGLFEKGMRLSSDMLNSHKDPVFSVHADQPWDCRIENHTKCAAVMYAADDYYLYIAGNFDKYDHILSIPHLPKGFQWSMIANTGENVSTDEKFTHEIRLMSYSVSVFAGKKI